MNQGGTVDQNVCEKAKNIYKSVNDVKQRPSNRRTSMAACVYLAAKENQEQPSSSRKALDEISNMFLVGRKKIQKVSKTSREVLYQKNSEAMKKWAPAEATDEIERIQNWIGPCEPSWVESAQEIARHAKENGFGLHAIPISLAVGCLWWIYQEVNAEFSVEKIAEAAECSVATVHRSYQSLLASKLFIDSLRTIVPNKLTTTSNKLNIIPNHIVLGVNEEVLIGSTHSK
jgi:transcription initiation factor TFIIIB Brf1 subunit/transcription initiation factor TFIIB